QVSSNRALVLEEVLCEFLVDDGDRGFLLGIEAREVAAVEHSNPHRLEVARRDRVHERLHVFPVLRLVAFDRHGAVPFVAGQQRNRREPGCCNARRGSKAIDNLEVEQRGAFGLVAAQCRRELEGYEIAERETGLGSLQILKAANKEAGPEQQQETERDLQRHQTLAEKERSTGAGN